MDASVTSPDRHPFAPEPDSTLTHPEWAKTASIYQINTRVFTEEGTFRAAMAHLPRLRDLGVTILWLMPVHEIGQLNRKGSLGSPYAVRDYYSVNHEFGTKEDLRAFVDAAHGLGMKVILDWVANHTAWDCVLLDEHPEWYSRDWKGSYRPTPWWDWDDIIDLDYSVPELRQYMTEALCYWVRDLDVDGFRCDVAGFVPTSFWVRARGELEKLKPVFLLAEWEDRDLHRAAFDMTYAWSWNQDLHHIATGTATLDAMHVYYSWNEKAYPRDAIRMMFVSNHDKNAWEGTQFEMFGEALEAAMVLTVIGEGMPLVYCGQEAGFDKRLEFFENDTIVWSDHPHGDLYRRLFAVKSACSALWNGAWGARMIDVPSDQHKTVLSFVREQGEDKVFAVFNFSDAPVEATFGDHVSDDVPDVRGLHHGAYVDFGTGQSESVGAGYALSLPAWGWKVLLAGPAADAVRR